MELLAVTIAGFMVALLSPIIVKATRLAPWILAVFPAGLTAYFVTQLPGIADGDVVTETHRWVSTLGIDYALRLDGLSVLFALLICGVGTLVVIYTGSYMEGHPRLGRFYLLLFLFMASMLGLVLADNLIVMFVFWELTSISSFGLIGFDSEKESSRSAASQALFVTGGTGLALLAGVVLLSIAGGTTSISELIAGGNAPIHDHSFYTPILILVLVGAFAKSAQFPFYFWLPNAMAAPTPVSAYLHSATMVKAGVYLVARLTPVLGGSDTWFYALVGAGGITMVIGALFALRETDLKRILAYSTIATLGMLVLLIGAGTQETMLAAMVLLLAHATYKATLFLNAGIIDHETGSRDLQHLGGLRHVMPITTTTTVLAASSMAGVIFLFGFIAKESVYESLQLLPEHAVITTIAVMLASVLLVTVALVIALKPFFGPRLAPKEHVHEGGPRLYIGPVILCLLGLGLGAFPAVLDTELLVPAADAATGEASAAHLALWHGLNLTLVLSVVTLIAGAALYVSVPSVRRTLRTASQSTRLSPEFFYASAMDRLPISAGRLTRVLQHGYLRLYISVVVVAATILGGGTLALQGGFDWPDTTSNPLFYEVLVAFVIFAAALVAVLARTRIVAAIALGGVGYGIALMYMMYGAPDLAMTQILVETLVVLLFVFAFYRLPRFVNYTTKSARLRDMAISICAGTLVMALMLTVLSMQREPSVSNTMAEMSKPLAHGSNVVNVILVDFRALDTMGEITVLLVAAVGVLALLRITRSEKEQE